MDVENDVIYSHREVWMTTDQSMTRLPALYEQNQALCSMPVVIINPKIFWAYTLYRNVKFFRVEPDLYECIKGETSAID